MLLIRQSLIFFSFFIATVVYAKPYIPASENDVIGVFSVSAEISAIKKLRNKLKNSQNDFVILNKVVSYYIKVGREKSDPRYFGYAEALLKPYLKYKNLPENLLIHWADILQHQHKFEKSLMILDGLVRRQSSFAQVYLMRAVIHVSRGDYDLAMENCKSLILRGSHLLTVSCVAQVKSFRGQLHDAFLLLEKTLQKSIDADIDVRLWAMGILADMSSRQGEYEIAEKYYQQALVLKPNDYYILSNYADLLMYQSRFDEVLSLLKGFSYVDNLLLWQLIAQKNINGVINQHDFNKLSDSYRLLEIRGEVAHLRDQARFFFEIKEDDEKSFLLAQQNWQRQKEPADFKLLLNIAIKSKHNKDIQPAIDWFNQQKTEDVTANNLMQQLVAY